MVTPAFQGRLPVDRHRMIYAALGDAMQSDIHALALETLTPTEQTSESDRRTAMTTMSNLPEDLKQRIEKTLAQDRIMLFMKGSPAMPQCGFSAAVVQILKQVGVPFGIVNILADAELREGLKQYANWPTYPAAVPGRQAGRRLRHRARAARARRAGAAAVGRIRSVLSRRAQ